MSTKKKTRKRQTRVSTTLALMHFIGQCFLSSFDIDLFGREIFFCLQACFLCTHHNRLSFDTNFEQLQTTQKKIHSHQLRMIILLIKVQDISFTQNIANDLQKLDINTISLFDTFPNTWKYSYKSYLCWDGIFFYNSIYDLK